MPIMSILLLAAVAAAPTPGPIKTFGDWAVACDNVHRCEMTSLEPADNDIGEHLDISIVLEPGPTGGFTIDVTADHPSGTARILVDGKVAGGVTARNDQLTLDGDVARRVVTAMANGAWLTLTDAGGTQNGRASLAGSAAALRFIDAEQRRAGTVTAAMAKGDMPASAVPAAPPLPHIVAIRPGTGPAKVTPALIRAMIALSKCDPDDTRSSDPIAGDAIGGGATLVLLPCGAGAYNFSTVPFIIIAGKPMLARFDAPTEGDGAVPMLVNAGWDAKTRLLYSYDKGRGVGDCGNSAAFAWDGHSFHLVEQTRMDECRGSANWLTVWRATLDRL